MGGTTTALHNERRRERNNNPIEKHTYVILALVPPIQGEILFEGLGYSIPEVETSGLDIALLQSAFSQCRKPILLYNDYDITPVQRDSPQGYTIFSLQQGLDITSAQSASPQGYTILSLYQDVDITQMYHT